MGRTSLGASIAAALLLLAGCSSSGGDTVITVLGYTVKIKTAPPTTAPVGTSIPVAFTVTENESDGTSKPAAGKSLTVAVTAGGGTINGGASAVLTTAGDGSLSLTWILGSTIGTQMVRGSVASDQYLDVSVTATAPPVSSVVVTLAAPSVVLGTVGDQASAVTKDANGNVLLGRTVTWQSSNLAVATVSVTGGITTVGVGTSTITATSEGQSGGALLTVTPVPVATVTTTLAAATITLGTVGDLATAITKDASGNILLGRTVTWQSSNIAVATVSVTGSITTVGVGTSTITATSEGQSGGALLTVTPVPVAAVTTTLAAATIALGTVGDQASAVTKDASGNVLIGRTVTWQSSNLVVATVSVTGGITTVGVGTSTITATSEGQSGGALLTVTGVPVATVTTTLAAATITLGTADDLATAVTKDASGNVLLGRTVTWQSSNLAVATVSTTGGITTVGVGTSTITATSEGQSGGALLTVTAVRVQTIYWSLFSVGPFPQIQLTTLPLTAGSTVTNVPRSATLQSTSGMTFDASGRLWAISVPQGGESIVAAVFTLPVTATSTPALVFTLPASDDIDFLGFDQTGNLWASDYANNREYMFVPPFTASRTLIPSVTLSLPGFSQPTGNAVDAAGNVYVANLGSTGTKSIAVFKAPITSASVPAFFLNGLNYPGGLIFDAQGNLYASSQPSGGQSLIVRYNSNNLTSGAVPNIVNPTGLGRQNYEAAFAFDAAGNLFVADCGAPNNGAGIRSYPTGTTPFSSTLAPSATYTNATINSIGCVWGIAIR